MHLSISKVPSLLLLLIALNSCNHPSRYNETPLTNNTEATGHKEDWKPNAQQPWWKASIYATLKGWTDEYNNEK